MLKPDEIDALLTKTSRTFALAIPLLPEPTRQTVALAYLLFRVADTFEDAVHWSSTERISALEEFGEILRTCDVARMQDKADAWLANPPVDHPGYLELLKESARVVASLDTLDVKSRNLLVHFTGRTTQGMADIVRRGNHQGQIHLASIQELKEYCYVVAGIVGEMLTAIFVCDAPMLHAVAPKLCELCASFGEGLQLVNILKDSFDDSLEGRVYLPPNVPLSEVVELARQDLAHASEYVDTLQNAGAPNGFLSFTALPLVLAQATLGRFSADGASSKVSRADVAGMFAEVQNAISSRAKLREITLQAR